MSGIERRGQMGGRSHTAVGADTVGHRHQRLNKHAPLAFKLHGSLRH